MIFRTIRPRWLLPACLLVAVAAVTASVSRADSAGWTSVASPSPGSDSNLLYALAADSSSDAWAVGEQYPGSGALIEHWNGSSWSLSASPAFAVDPVLRADVALSPTDAWAVGDYYDNAGSRRAVIEHWDGAGWTVTPTPDPGSTDSLDGIAAVSANDIWAAGQQASTTSAGTTLIEHWDGSSWQTVPSPATGSYASLRGIAAISANDVWAVGAAGGQTLTEHWNGGAWQIVKSPSPSAASHYLSAENVLTAVSATSSSDVWAVGTYDTTKGSDAAYHTLVEHWNGSKWSLVSSPDAQSGYSSTNELDAITALAPTDIWAVGHSKAATYNATDQTLIEHWNGTAWSVATSPTTASWSSLNAIASPPGGGLWAAGADADQVTYEGAPISPQTLILRR